MAEAAGVAAAEPWALRAGQTALLASFEVLAQDFEELGKRIAKSRMLVSGETGNGKSMRANSSSDGKSWLQAVGARHPEGIRPGPLPRGSG